MKPPLPHSYWVEPGYLLAGEHPDAGKEGATRARLQTLAAAGVRHFIDLTQPHELSPYQDLLPAGISYENFPMRDHSLPDSRQQMRDLQQALAAAMKRGGVYIHCRAGIGRTGVAVGCYLREQGESGTGALAELNRLWQQNARAASWPSIPETPEQESYVRDWLVGATAAPLQRWRGCLVGLAIGDVMASQAAEAGGQAAWTDDTGMALCVAESLLARDGFDGRDQLDRYREWARDPQAAGAAPSAELRPNVLGVLARSMWNRTVFPGTHDPAQIDPSPLSCAAAAALFAAPRVDAAASLAADCARVTHQAPVLVDACRLFAAMIARALAGSTREAVLAGVPEGMPLRDDVLAMAADWGAQPSGRRKPLPGVAGVLDRAVRCFARSRAFGDGLSRALDSPGADRDAVCAAYGALAGAFHGEDAIDSSLRGRVAGLSRLTLIADRLCHGSAKREVIA
jgi:ADP-ribosyl-[dinitrogen reductase] hydrolase